LYPCYRDTENETVSGLIIKKMEKVFMKGFQKPQRLTVDMETLTDTYGHFSAQPFERGFGTTVGNSLRRILLSAIEGAAITAVKIDGVLHEFSTLTGVREDVTNIIMNLKQIPIRMHVDTPKTIYLKSSGKACDLTSGDIETDPDVEILDPDIRIATVDENVELSMEMRVQMSRGYVSADENYEEELDICYIPVDSVHSPVTKVNFWVEATRLGQSTDYDQLNLLFGQMVVRNPITPSARPLRSSRITCLCLLISRKNPKKQNRR